MVAADSGLRARHVFATLGAAAYGLGNRATIIVAAVSTPSNSASLRTSSDKLWSRWEVNWASCRAGGRSRLHADCCGTLGEVGHSASFWVYSLRSGRTRRTASSRSFSGFLLPVASSWMITSSLMCLPPTAGVRLYDLRQPGGGLGQRHS